MALRDLVAAISPPWLLGDIGARYMYTPSLMTDAMADRVEQGTLAKMPEKSDPTCLQYIGRDRTTVRGIAETDGGYAGRCKTAIYDWHFAGIRGVIRTLLGYLSPSAPMIRMVWSSQGSTHYTQWAWLPDGATRQTMPLTLSNMGSATPYFVSWNWDGIENRRRFWTILYVNQVGAPWVQTVGKYGDGSKYGDGQLYGVKGITKAQANTMRSLVKPWKAAHSRCEWIVISFDNALFDPLYEADLPGANSSLPDGHWGSYGKDVSGHYVHARSSSARYVPGVG